MPRRLNEIAKEIYVDWHFMSRFPLQKHSHPAKPYLMAMFCLAKLEDRYYAEKADDIVLYFLSNAASWRGAVATRIKAELNEMLFDYRGNL